MKVAGKKVFIEEQNKNYVSNEGSLKVAGKKVFAEEQKTNYVSNEGSFKVAGKRVFTEEQSTNEQMRTVRNIPNVTIELEMS